MHDVSCFSCRKTEHVESVFRLSYFVRPQYGKTIEKTIRKEDGKTDRVVYQFLCDECKNIKDILE